MCREMLQKLACRMGMGEPGYQESQIPARAHRSVDALTTGISVYSSSGDDMITMTPVEGEVRESAETRSLVKKSLDGNIGT